MPEIATISTIFQVHPQISQVKRCFQAKHKMLDWFININRGHGGITSVFLSQNKAIATWASQHPSQPTGSGYGSGRPRSRRLLRQIDAAVERNGSGGKRCFFSAIWIVLEWTFELRFFVDCGALSFCWCLRGGYGLPTRPQWEPTRAQVVGNLPTRPTRVWFC